MITKVRAFFEEFPGLSNYVQEKEVTGTPRVERVDSQLLARRPGVIEISGFGFHLDGHSRLFEESVYLLDDNFKEIACISIDRWKACGRPKGWRGWFWSPNPSQAPSIGNTVLSIPCERIAYILSIQDTWADNDNKKILVLHKAPRDRSLMHEWARGNFTDEREKLKAEIAVLEY